MSEMIERVARASKSHWLSRFMREDGSVQAWVIYSPTSRVVESFPPDQSQEAAAALERHNARSAIAAIREPTAEMLAAGSDCAGETIDPEVAADVRLGWQAMIDEALK